VSGPDNPPAFAAAAGGENQCCQPGMTLRDWFAGQIVGGMMACPNGGPGWIAAAKKLGVEPDAAMSRGAYTMADAMLAERERKA
jgi:hypothetical protein